MEANLYSQQWFESFHVGIPEARTAQEIEFICNCAPLPEFRRVLDVCCGMGRHARALTSRGYNVTGLERDAVAIAKARQLGGGPSYIHRDVRDYPPEVKAFDLAIVMSQSFGYFDATTNREVLRKLTSTLRERGRLILDLWWPEFFEKHQGERDLVSANGIVRERKKIENNRLFVHLDYPDGSNDHFEFELFTPWQMSAVAESAGLKLLVTCTDFDAAIEPSSVKPRVQYVLEREHV